jgi:CheY-like chemotaxis protein
MKNSIEGDNRKRPEAAPASAIDGRASVLVLDDDPALRELFGAMLERVGCRAKICSSSAQAIDLYRSAATAAEAFDCAIIDLNIDEKIDGITVGRVLREMDPRVRLVLVSGSVDPQKLASHKVHGFDAVLPKPFSLKQLRETVLAPP